MPKAIPDVGDTVGPFEEYVERPTARGTFGIPPGKVLVITPPGEEIRYEDPEAVEDEPKPEPEEEFASDAVAPSLCLAPTKSGDPCQNQEPCRWHGNEREEQ